MLSQRLFVASTLVLAACSSPAKVTLEEAPGELGMAVCQRLTECSVLGLALLSQTSCEVGAYQYRNDVLALLDDWVTGGTVIYDEEAMAGCLDDIAAVSCIDLAGALTDVGRCADAIAGTVATGGACQGSMQCAAGLFCDLDLTCPGTCAARVGAGGSCPADAGCQSGLSCEGGTCAALLVGGDPCASSFACAPGFTCDLTGGSGICRPLSFTATAGQACNPPTGQLCERSLACAALDTSGTSFQCQAMSTVGGVCATAAPSQCPVGSVCAVLSGEVTGSCVTLPGENQPCLTSASLVLNCAEELACDFDLDICVRRLDNGATCTGDVQCANSCAGVCTDPDCTS